MSTILEALRRAEQERNRGKVPTLHGPSSVLAVPLPPSGSQHASRWLWGGAAIACSGAIAVALWGLQRPEPPRLTTTATKPVATAPVAAVAAPPERPAPAVLEKEPPQAAERSPLPPPAPHKRAQAPVTAAPAKARRSEAHPQQQATKAAPVPAKAQVSGPVFAPADLPASVRADLPRLHLAGITYSANAKLRMAIVNGQVLHEGESAIAGLVLERVEPGRTIWAFRGYRIALTSE